MKHKMCSVGQNKQLPPHSEPSPIHYFAGGGLVGLFTSFLMNGLFFNVPTLFLFPPSVPLVGLTKSFLKKGLSFNPPPTLPGPVLDSATATLPGEGGAVSSILGARRPLVVMDIGVMRVFSTIGSGESLVGEGVLRPRLGRSLKLGKGGIGGDATLFSARTPGGP